MIVSRNNNGDVKLFEGLLTQTIHILEKDSRSRPKYYSSAESSTIEKEVENALKVAAKGTSFAGTICLKSGHKFPDIVAKKWFGVEVKTSKQNHWRTTGNSVLEETRIEGVEKIYILFAKLIAPAEFRFRFYEECIYDFAVTHSPRYLIDMDTPRGRTIFEKIRKPYNELRKDKNAIRVLINYARKLVRPGDETWWMGVEDDIPPGGLTIKLWNNLDRETQEKLKYEIFVLFPEVTSASQKKFGRAASWLVLRKGVIHPNFRDTFTAGGRVTLSVGGRKYKGVPKVFKNLQKGLEGIEATIENIDEKDIKLYWNKSVKFRDRRKVWRDMIIQYSRDTISNAKSNLDLENML